MLENFTCVLLPMRSRHRARRRSGAAGGASRDRTGDLLLAKQALSQLSYGPVSLSIGRNRSKRSRRTLLRRPEPDPGGSGRSCTSDLTLIRGAL